jgi:CRP-like cAMP-binding protein
VGFEAFYGGRSLAFSGDTLYDPERIRGMYNDGTISLARCQDLLAFPWHHTVVLHEAGIPPLHTPIDALAALPTESKRRLYLVHVAEKDVPDGLDLRRAAVGLESTIRIDAEPPAHADAIEILSVFCDVDLFSDFPISRAGEILQVSRRTAYDSGTRIVEEGSPGDTFYIILKGTVSVRRDGEELKTYHAGDYFGETALVLDRPRNADVVAATDVELVEIDRYDFLYLLRGTNVQRRLIQLARMREAGSWEVFQSNSVLCSLTTSQKTQLQSYIHARWVSKDDVLWTAGDSSPGAIIVDDARLQMAGGGGDESLDPFGRGAFLCEMEALSRHAPLATTVKVLEPGRVFEIDQADLDRFFEENPRLLVSFQGTRFVE